MAQDPIVYRLTQHDDCPVSDIIIESLERYLNAGIIPGSFLTAALENNLREAFGCADEENTANMRNIVAYLYNHVPAGAWGSREAVASWVERAHLKERQPTDATLMKRWVMQKGIEFYVYDSPEDGEGNEELIVASGVGFVPAGNDKDDADNARLWFLNTYCPDNGISPIWLGDDA